MNTDLKRKTGLWVGVGIAGLAILAGGVYWQVYAGQGRWSDDLASGDADRMRAGFLKADTDQLGSREGRATRELTIEAMKNMSIEDFMGLWDDDSLSDEERERMMENMRTLFMKHMADTAEDYMAASEEERVALLDKQLDDWKSFGDRMREYREAHEDDPEYQKRREEQRKRWRERSRSTEDRRQQMGDANPDQQAKMFFMFGKMRERAKERGMDMGWGRGGDRDGDDADASSRRRRDRRRGGADGDDGGE
ncbi:MAG: hypothetical protein GY778_26115 [bacterium]|nr:hypothetical protein [bacterium]